MNNFEITSAQLLQMIGEKQVQLDLAQARNQAMMRAWEEHMREAHPVEENAPALTPVGEDSDG